MPALVLFAGLPVHLAIGTSLLAIVMKNAAALGGHIFAVSINWPITLAFTALAIVGSLFGARLAARISAKTLRTGFGWFVLLMGIFVIGQSLCRCLINWLVWSRTDNETLPCYTSQGSGQSGKIGS